MFFEVKPRLPGDTKNSANIVGCDYSAAAKQPNATWIATGRLESLILHIDSLKKIGSDRLLENLLALKNSSDRKLNARQADGTEAEYPALSPWIIGLDFPFSFPAPFAEILLQASSASTDKTSQTSQTCQTSKTSQTSQTWRFSQISQTSPKWMDLANCVSSWPYEKLRAQVLSAKPIMGGEVKRLTDNCTSPKAQSPLHQINPGMLKMTWQGMQLLLTLQKEGFAILPFATTAGFSPEKPARAENPDCDAPHFTAEVLEVYPAAVLKLLGQPWRKYKGNNPEAKQLRQFILKNLTSLNNLTGPNDKLRSVNRIAIAIPGLSLAPNLEQFALASDDAIDAVIAALGAAIAYLNPSQTAPPRQISTDLIALEGWIYVSHPKTIEATLEVMA